MERTTEACSRAPTGFHDLDELLLGPTELEAMPFEFGCDFASAFEDKHLDVDALALSHRSSSRPKEAKRSHKRKSDSLASSSLAPRSLPLFTSLPAALDTNTPDAAPSCEATALGSTQIGRWTKKEHELFLEGLRLYGKSWKKISSLVVTRTLVQIRTHAQKYLQKQTKSAMKAAAAAAAGTSSTVPVKNRKAASHVEQATWKHHHHHDNHASVFLPIAFPEHVAGSSPSSSSASSSHSSSSSSSPFVHHKDLGLPSISSMSKLDQLLHDDSSQAATVHDDYYSSPTGTDDELVQWLQHRHLPYLSSPAAPKRRRTDASSAWAMVNPMEAMAAHNSVPHASGYYSSHGHQSTATSSDYLPPLSAYASSQSSTTAATSHSDSEYSFSSPWL